MGHPFSVFELSNTNGDTEPGELRIVRNAAREEYRLAYDREGHVERREHFDGRVYRLGWKNGDLHSEPRSVRAADGVHVRSRGGASCRARRRRARPSGSTWGAMWPRSPTRMAPSPTNATRPGQVVRREPARHGDSLRARRHGPAHEADDAVGRDEGTPTTRTATGSAWNTATRRSRSSATRWGGRSAATSAPRARAPSATFDQAFDPVGRLTGQRYRPGGKEDVAWWRHVQYDAVGNPTRIADSARGTKDYLHNAAGQLVGVLHDGKAGEFYDWDSRGNIVYEAEIDDASGVFAAVAQQMDRMGAVLAKAPRRSTERRFGKGSRISESKHVDKTITYVHDAAGCVVDKTVRYADGRVETYKFEWNTLGQMVRAVVPDGSDWRYDYDPAGRRSSKRASRQTTISTVWDGVRPMRSSESAAKRALASSTAISSPGSSSAAIHVDESSGSNSADQFCLVDQTGSSLILVFSTSELQLGYQDTWGGQVAGSRHSPPCGQSLDEETGLHYNLLRHYDPQTRRYLSPDPLDSRAGSSEFSYVRSPVRWSDALGAAEECPSDQESGEEKQRKFTGIGDPGLENFVQRLQEAGINVTSVNIEIAGPDGNPLGEVDVVTENALIQYKNGPSSASDIIEQVQEKTEPYVDRPVVAFINDEGKAGNRNG